VSAALQLSTFDEHEAPTRPSLLPLGIIDELWTDLDEDDEPTVRIERSVVTRNPEPLGDVVARELERIRKESDQ